MNPAAATHRILTAAPVAALITCVGTALGVVGACAVDLAPVRQGGLAAGVVACFVAFVIWPWAILPVDIVGGVVTTGVEGDSEITFVVAVHAAIVVVGVLAVATRRVLDRTESAPRTPLDVPMALAGAVAAAGALYGLAVGNTGHHVLVATYEIGIIPAYFFVASRTLTDARRLRAATVLYVASATVLAAVELTTPGRHGGLLSVLAAPPLFIAASRVTGWRRAGLVALGALCTVDVVIASYRATWVAYGLTVLAMLVFGRGQLRRVLVAALASAAVLIAGGVAVSGGIGARYQLVGQELGSGAGYRLSEAMVGLRVFVAHPFVGAGLGQVTPHVYLPGFTTTDVGPVYHVFWVMILANAGAVGLAALLWPLGRALRLGLRSDHPQALAAAALTFGFVVAACFAGPSDGQWELGLLPALVALLTGQVHRRRRKGRTA